MQQTYTIASEKGSLAIIRTNTYEDGSFVEFKQVANRDGSFVGFRRNSRRTEWRKDSWGKKAAERFQWVKEAADAYFS